MPEVLVTVGMSPWPFDRLVAAIAPLCSEHRIFAQTGSSRVLPPCEHAPYIPFPELLDRIQRADVVITHAGNTVRLVQRAGKVPIVVARSAAKGEMANDHQITYLRHEEHGGRVVAAWDLTLLPRLVAEHPTIESRLLGERPLPNPADASLVAARLDELWRQLVENPFKDHHLRRYAYAWEELAFRSGRHLDIGCGSGEFLSLLAQTSSLDCYGVDPHAGYLRQARARDPSLSVARVGIHGPLPCPDQHFSSVSLLDVLEHCPSEDTLLDEVRRVLLPGGLLVVTVPARHLFSWLDPDNVKFRMPRLHRAVYSLRFGRETYHERFVDRSNGLVGDMSVGKDCHTNYAPAQLFSQLRRSGFEITRVSGANLFWRWLQIPSLFLGPGRDLLERAIRLDGDLFHHANLFLSARRVG